MRLDGRRCLICSCDGSMTIDGQALAKALGATSVPTIHTQLCRREIASFESAITESEPLLVACGQEEALFTEAAGDRAPDMRFVDIRDRAGWSAEGRTATAKMAALIAEATLDIAPAPALTLRSSGRCLVYGDGQIALDVARRLAGRLAVTLLLRRPGELLPERRTAFPVMSGSIGALAGHLGAIRASIHDAALPHPSARAALAFGTPAVHAVEHETDIVLDLAGGRPLLTAADKRDGYLRADPRDPLAVERQLLAATDLVGEFDKPRYITFAPELCAHSRSRRVGCTRCLDHCPTGAIVPAGDHVTIDPLVCAGCGACSALCPTGAATYAMPAPDALITRLRTLLGTYLGARGGAPVILAHEERHGADLIAASARLGRGLPSRVLPFAVGEITQLGIETLTSAFAYGAATLVLLVPPRKEAEFASLELTIGYTRAILEGLGYGKSRIVTLTTDDPDELETLLWKLPLAPPTRAASFLPMGSKRALLRLALDELHRVAPAPVPTVPLPEGAVFGRVTVDVPNCTLCLACVGACPTGALLENPDRPMLRFIEDACVQCGLCKSTCPEKVITLEPRLAFTAEAKAPITIKEEEPARCVRCGKVFGTKSSIERIKAKLVGAHWMFQSPEQAERLEMCDDCRVASQFEAKDNPYKAATDRRPIRTTDDYFREREELEAARRKLGRDEPDEA